MYWVKFNTSSADSSIRYLFGDIDFSFFKKKTKDKTEKILSGLGCTGIWYEKNIKVNEPILSFRKQITENVSFFEPFIGTESVIHFDFGDVIWYKNEDILNELDRLSVECYTEKIGDRRIFSKSAFCFLNKDSLQCPNFSEENTYKVASFTWDEVLDLMYSQSSFTPISYIGTSYCIIYLPYGENIDRESLVRFLETKKYSAKIEEQIFEDNKKPSDELLGFVNLDDKEEMNDIQFDIIFQKKNTTTNSNILLLNSIYYSWLKYIFKNMKKYQLEVLVENSITNVNLTFFDSLKSFFSTKTESSFFIKWIYHFYNGDYRNPFLTKRFIQLCEEMFRSEEYKNKKNYLVLKTKFDFLKKIENKNYNFMKDDNNFKLGQFVGKLSQSGKNYRENLLEFVRQFAGYIDRRIRTKEDVVKYVNELQKRVFRNDYYQDKNLFLEYMDILSEITEFNQEIFSCGFFDGFNRYEKTKKEE